MRWRVYSPDYGSSFDMPGDEDGHEEIECDAFVECEREDWRPLTPLVPRAETVAFVDGVQRTDGELRAGETEDAPGRFVSLAAGMVLCDGAARVIAESVRIRRIAVGPFGLDDVDCGNGVVYYSEPVADPSDKELLSKVHRERERLEVAVAESIETADLKVIDGHLRHREKICGAIGLLKSHSVRYLQPEQHAVIAQLLAGQRTPVFLINAPWQRYSWYAALPVSGDRPGIIRCEASAAGSLDEVTRMADTAAVTLPRYASEPHKDPRAPQNLYPVGGLERDLRRRLGDQALLMRYLMRASTSSSA